MGITVQDGKVVLRDDKVGTEQACCCQPCECGPINCTVTFSVDGVEYTWNVTGPGNETFYVLPDGYLCFETVEGSRLTGIQGCAICENGKYKIAVGVVMQSFFTSGDCYRWCPEEGRYIDVFYQKAKLHILEVSACDCTAIIDLGVQEFEMFTGGCEGSFGATASACLALAGNFVSYTSCGEICGDYEGPPEDCPEPPAVIFPVRQWPEACDPDNHTISDVSVECCPCSSSADCPVRLPEDCEDFYPGSPYNCCDGQCKEYPCWPGALVTFTVLKKDGPCVGQELDYGLVPAGQQFTVLVGGWSNVTCEDISTNGYLYIGEWEHDGCDVIQGSLDAKWLETDCYEIISYTSCRQTCAYLDGDALACE